MDRRRSEPRESQGQGAYIVGHHVEASQCDEDLASHVLSWILVVGDGDDELQNATDAEAGHHDLSASAPADDNQGVEDNGEDAHDAEDIRHGERVGTFDMERKYALYAVIRCYQVSKPLPASELRHVKKGKEQYQ